MNLKINFKVFAFVFLYSGLGVAKNNKINYPRIQDLTGKVFQTSSDGKKTLGVRGSSLNVRALIQTESGAKAVIQLDGNRFLTLQENSEIEIPSISWETREAPFVILNRGSLRWRQDLNSKSQYPIALRSPLFEFLSAPGDYVLTFKSEVPWCQLLVISGRLDFAALNSDEGVMVQSGQKASFTGVLEGVEIAYDILLKGKKIPRGKMSQVEGQNDQEKDLYSLAREDRLKGELQKKAKELEKKRKELTAGQICSDPGAKFNECRWVCLGNPKTEKKKCLLTYKGVHCLRERCNANGQWSDPSEVELKKAEKLCSALPVVGLCDY